MVPFAENFYQHLRAPAHVGLCLCVSDNQPICGALAAINCTQALFQYTFHFAESDGQQKCHTFFLSTLHRSSCKKIDYQEDCRVFYMRKERFQFQLMEKYTMCSVFSCKNIPLRIPTKPICNKHIISLDCVLLNKVDVLKKFFLFNFLAHL